MPGTPKHPVTLGDLRVHGPNSATAPFVIRPATVADLVSAIRAEGVLVVEKVGGEWPDWAKFVLWLGIDRRLVWYEMLDALAVCSDPAKRTLWLDTEKFDEAMQRTQAVMTDALAEAQPFPPAGGVS